MPSALQFVVADSAKVSLGNPAHLNNVLVGTMGTWATISSVTTAQELYHKATFPNARVFKVDTTSGGRLLLDFARATTNLKAEAILSNFAHYALNTWIYIVFQWNTAGGATTQKLMIGDRSNAPAEPSSYVTQTTGSGGTQDDSGALAFIGNHPSVFTSWAGGLAYFGIWNRLLAASEIGQQQYSPHNLLSDCLHFNQLGYNGAGYNSTQHDRSSYLNHGTLTWAINGTPVTAIEGPPLPIIGRSSMIVPAAVTTAPPYLIGGGVARSGVIAA